VSTAAVLRVPSRGYNPPPMKYYRLLLVALALAVSCGVASAQGFNSVSSGTPLDDTPPEATAPAVAFARPANCAPPNPFLTGAAAAAAEKQCEALNPFLSGPSGAATATAIATQAPEATAPADAHAAQAAAAGGTVPFGSSYGEAIQAAPAALEPADRVLVKKSERRLYLLHADRVIADYPIRLGLNPNGAKLREGDFRTPEGIYELSRRNQHSDFFLALEVSYPNAADIERARELGVRPGGLIMIHGQPNTPRKPPDYYASNDWTDGCIAVSNSAMVDIWLRTSVGTPIEIRP
jgi:hypothetical protein